MEEVAGWLIRVERVKEIVEVWKRWKRWWMGARDGGDVREIIESWKV